MSSRSVKMLAFVGALLVGLLVTSTASAVTNVTAQIDPQTTEVNRTFDYIVDVSSSESGRVAFASDPDFGDLRVVGRQQRSSFQAGAAASRTLSIIFSLRASKPGNYTIGGPTVIVGSKRYEVGDETVKVVPRGKAPAPKVDADSPYSIELDISPDREPYVGEQITATFKLLRDARAANAQPTIPTEPALDDFWTEDLTDARGYQRQTIRSGGKLYEQISIRIYGLFPLKSGPAEIEPMTVELQTGGFFQRPQSVTLRSKPKKLDVKPLPPNAPEGFSESNVGQWTFSTRVDHRATKVGRPITLELIAEGEGHIERLTLPDFGPIDGARITHSDVDQRRFKGSRTIGGRKVKRLTLMPTREGTLEIPSVIFHHFDPQSGEYQTTTTEPISVRVAPGELPDDPAQRKTAARADTEEEDVIETLVASLAGPVNVTSASSATNPFETIWFWLLVLLPVAGLLYFWLDAPVRGLRRNRAPKRRRAASAGKAHEALSGAASWDELYGALRAFLAERLDIAAGRVTGDDISAALQSAGIEPELARRVEELIVTIEQARFSGGATAPGPAQIEQAKRLVDELVASDERPSAHGSTVATLLVAGAFAALSLSPAPAYAEEASAHQLFENGEYARAADRFAKAADANPTIEAHAFNAGTAYARAGDFGRARLYLERASYLSPWDSSISNQLETVRRIVRLRSIETSRTGMTMEGDEPLIWWRFGTRLWLPAIAIAILFGLWLALAGQMTRRFSRRAALRDAAFVALVAGLLIASISGAGAAVREAALSTVEPAVLIRAEPLRDGPSQHAKEIALPKTVIPGNVVRVLERRGEWVKIALPGKLSGWTKNGAITSIAPHET